MANSTLEYVKQFQEIHRSILDLRLVMLSTLLLVHSGLTTHSVTFRFVGPPVDHWTGCRVRRHVTSTSCLEASLASWAFQLQHLKYGPASIFGSPSSPYFQDV